MAKTKEHSIRYDRCKKLYPKGVTKEQMRKYVELGALYDWEYKEITGEDY